MTKHKIIIGDPANPIFELDNDQLRQVNVVLRNSYSGDELAYDQLNAASFAGEQYELISNEGYDLYSSQDYQLISAPAILTEEIPAEAAIRYYINNVLVGKFYAQPADRENMLVFDVNAVSAIGILAQKPHMGGLYNGVPFSQVAADIIGGAIPFSCSPDVASISVYNWLPYTKDARENLHQLLFAYGVMVFKNADGDVYFDFANTNLVKTIDENKTYADGNVTPVNPITMVRVAEHQFFALPTDIEYTLFDNSGGVVADNLLVLFEHAPIHDLTATGTLQIIKSGVNYAIVSGNGVLTGKSYTHTQQFYEEGVDNGNVLEITEQTLVNQFNSINVAHRLLNYYGVTEEISTDIQVTTEKPGQLVKITNPYKIQQNAYIREMTMTGLATVKARCEMLANFTPTKGGNNYEHFALYTENGTFVVPNGVETIRVIIAQGGQGGEGGKSGGVGDCGTPGVGGEAGKGGTPGKLFITNIPVTPGQSFAITVGAPGTGGEPNAAGTDGEESTFGTYSSADGIIPQSGYYDEFAEEYYAVAGEDGIPGASGGDPNEPGGDVTFNDTTWTGGASAPALEVFSAIGGGGAAYGANGGDATPNAHNDRGRGGNGADALIRVVAANLACGGVGGNGGGGPGAGPYDRSICWASAIGSPGAGSAGNDGGQGFVGVLY